jgi:protein SCO1/2
MRNPEACGDECADPKPRSAIASFAAIGAALTPKCPLCLMAIAGGLGLPLTALGPWLLPLTIVLLLVSLTSMAFAARARRRYVAFGVAMAGAAIVLAARFYFPTMAATGAGALVMIAAAMWIGAPKRMLNVEC